MKNLYQHGGNIYEVKLNKHESLIDFSANINPLGIPKNIKKTLTSEIKNLVHYPDPQASLLIEALASHWKIKEENILLGNGSTELIYLILNTFKPARLSLPVPSFSEYERAARISNCRIKFIRLEENEGFTFALKKINQSDMLILANPNNPTGNLLLDNRLRLKNLPIKKVIIDEAFMDFEPQEDKHSFIQQAVCSKKIIVLRTFTKLFALPGLRIGYLIAHPQVIRKLKKYQMPWSVNSLAQKAAIQALKENSYIRRTKQFIAQENKFLKKNLEAISGLKVYPSSANFLLVKIKGDLTSASSLKENLLSKGILIRDCANFRGLNSKYFRVALRKRADNLKLIKTIRQSFFRKESET